MMGYFQLISLWKHYFQAVLGLVLVVDSTDRDRIEETKDFLKMVIDEVTNKTCHLNMKQVSHALNVLMKYIFIDTRECTGQCGCSCIWKQARSSWSDVCF